MDIFHIIGFLGMVCVVGAYLLLQIGRVGAQSLTFQLINLLGAILLIISLFVHFNLGSFLIEVFWIIITLYGIYKIYKKGTNG
ncbi:MAG: CBU_0592 family membrane protein [Campylobacter sp.]